MPFDPDENARKMRQNAAAAAAAAAAARKRAASTKRAGNARQNEKQRRWLKPAGVALLVVGGGIGVNHWLAHLGTYGDQPPGWVDLAAGYPMAGILLVIGGIAVGQR